MDKEYLEHVKDLIHKKELKDLEKITHHKFTNRYAHSVAVSYTSYRIAKRLGFSEESLRSIARGGLLHDLFFETREEYKDMGSGSHNYLHPIFALKNALKLTDINEVEEDIITKHMFLCTTLKVRPKYKESFLVSMVDKYITVTDVLIPLNNLAQVPVLELVERSLIQTPHIAAVLLMISTI